MTIKNISAKKQKNTYTLAQRNNYLLIFNQISIYPNYWCVARLSRL